MRHSRVRARNRYFLSTLLATLFVASLFLSPSAFSRNVSISQDDLYYFGADGIKVPLPLSPKIMVMFRSHVSPEKREEKLTSFRLFSPIEIKEITGFYGGTHTYVISFLPGVTPQRIFSDVEEILSDPDGALDANLVFIVGNREAAVDGVEIELKTEISSSVLESELSKMFPNIRVRDSKRAENKYVVYFSTFFFFEGSGIPSNQLMLANILSNIPEKTPWIKNVRPHFRFLRDSLNVAMRVVPQTGTVGEERTLVLSLHVSDPNIVAKESTFERFGTGGFVPSSPQAKIVPGFFSVNGEKTRFEKEGQHGKIIEFRWKFNLFAPATQWTIPPTAILYEKNGKLEKMMSDPATFFVLSHMKSGATFTDIPTPRSLSMPEFLRAQTRSSSLFNRQEFFFDSWFDDPKRTASITMLAGGVTLTLILIFLFLVHMRARQTRNISIVEKSLKFRILKAREQINKIEFAELSANEYCKKIENIIASLLLLVFPTLTRTLSISMVKEQKLLDDKTFLSLKSLGELLQMMHSGELVWSDKEKGEVMLKTRRFLDEFELTEHKTPEGSS